MSYLAASSMQRDSTMTEDQLKFPQWQEPLHLAILEPDPVRAAEKTEPVERMLRERLGQLQATDADSDATQLAVEQALIDALNVIRILRNNVT